MAVSTVSRRGVAVLDRTELEQKYIELAEENKLLKKHAKAQEEKMKKLATKLLRLTADEKRGLSLRKADGGPRVGGAREEEMEEMVIELQGKVREIEKQKANLAGKVTVLKQQLEARGKRHTQYDRVQPRVSSGLSRDRKKSFSTEDVASMKRHNVSTTQGSPGPVRYGHSLLEDARRDNEELEGLVLVLKKEVGSLQEEVEHGKEQIKMMELTHEGEVLQLKEQIQNLKTASQKVNLEDDVEKIRLQRELRLKSVSVQSLETQYSALEKNFESVKSSRDKLIEEVRLLDSQLKQEQSKTSSLQTQLHTNRISARDIAELQQLVTDLKMERDILKQSNERLMRSALTAPPPHEPLVVSSSDRDHDYSTQKLEKKLLEERLKEEETKLRQEAERHRTTSEKLHSEMELRENLCKELSQARSQLITLEKEHHSVTEKLTIYCQGTVDWKKIEEALIMYKLNEEKKDEGPFYQVAPVTQTECTGQCQVEVQELRLALAETSSELNKSKKLLSLQNTISQDCKREVEALREEMDHMRQDYERKIQEKAQLLDLRTARIRNLELQLKDIKYDPKKSSVKIECSSKTGANESVIDLCPGQNLLQVHLGQFRLSAEALGSLSSSSSSSTPSLFLCLSLAGHQTQVTPVEHSSSPVFGFTANYVVNVDEVFLEHLSNGSVSLELYQAFGMKYEELGSTSLPLRPLLSSGSETVHDKTTIKGMGKLAGVAQVGSLDYWIKLKIPVTQSAKAHQERPEHLMTPARNIARPLNSGSSAYDNEIIITIIRCTKLPLSNQGQPPSPYVMYKFYTYPDHDTPILSPTISPEFNDTHHFGVTRGSPLEQYLSNNDLEVFVFNDDEPNDNSYVGMVKVPLYSLANGENIKGTYPLQSATGSCAGQVTLSISWNSPYKEPSLTEASNRIRTTAQENAHLLLSDVPSLSDSSNDEPSTSPYQQLIKQPDPPSDETMRPLPHGVLLGSSVMDETSPTQSFKPKANSTAIDTITGPGDHTALSETQLLESNNHKNNIENLKESRNRNKEENGNEDNERDENEEDTLSQTENEEIDEEIEDDELTGVTDEGTLFEETPHSNASPELSLSKPPVILMKEEDNASLGGDSLELSSEGGEEPVIIKPLPPLTAEEEQQEGNSSPNTDVHFFLTILSFTQEEGSTLSSMSPTVTQIFVEYQFLDYDASELETPVSQPLPPPGQTAVFNFRKEFHISKEKDSRTNGLLMAMLHSSNPAERRIPFTVVSDPEDSDEEAECLEIGMAELDLPEVLKTNKDQTIEDLDVHSVDSEDIVGYLTVSLEGLTSLSNAKH